MGARYWRQAVPLLVAHPAVDQLVLVAGGNRAASARLSPPACPKPCAVVQGGATRADSVRNGLAAAKGQLVAIHDAARPFASEEVITAALDRLPPRPALPPRRCRSRILSRWRTRTAACWHHAGPRHPLRRADAPVL